MENQNPPNMGQNPIERQFSQQFGQQQQLPNSIGVLVLGIISIVGCICYGIVGVTCGIIALVLANKATAMYNANPGQYTLSSYNNMKAGRVCAIVGTSISGAYLLVVIIYLIVVGSFISTIPWHRY